MTAESERKLIEDILGHVTGLDALAKESQRKLDPRGATHESLNGYRRALQTVREILQEKHAKRNHFCLGGGKFFEDCPNCHAREAYIRETGDV